LADDNRIQLEIVTPKGRALAVTVDEVSLPGENGEFGVLPGHLPTLAAARTGLVTYRQGNESKKCAIGGGFIEVDRAKVVVITDEYIERAAIDPVIIRKELADVQAQLAKMLGEAIDRTQAKEVAASATLIAKENWLAAQLELYGDPPPATLRPYEEYGPPASNEDEAASESGTAPGAP
jgi:F-type H+-transporting ATPase subunit epsilon